MRLTKFGHACVRLDSGSGAVVVDPGTWSTDVDLDGVDGVLVTHEHTDHLDVDLLAPAVRDGLQLVTNLSLAERLRAEHGLDVRAVEVGERFSLGGFDVLVVGGAHAEIYEGLPGCANIGFVLDGTYHPGDALHVPEHEVETLLVPVSAPWLKLAEVLDFVRAVEPKRAFPIHDAMLSDVGTISVDRWIEGKGGTDYRRLSPGQSAEL